MSCGNPHKVPCTQVLEQVYAYIDGEMSDADCEEIREHLDECGPCLREFGLEEAVKRLVAKHCGCDPAPPDLRGKILVRIRQVRAEIEVADLPAAFGPSRFACPRAPPSGCFPWSIGCCMLTATFWACREFALPRYPVVDGT